MDLFEGVIVDLSDEDTKNLVLDLQSVYADDGELLSDLFGVFECIGIHDESYIHTSMMGIFTERMTPSRNLFDFNGNEIIKELKNKSRIKLDGQVYAVLSEAYSSFCGSQYFLYDSEDIRSNNICYAIDSIEKIYSVIGVAYSELIRTNELHFRPSDKSIHSLGGEGRSKKYKLYKDEIIKEWEKGGFHSYAECARKYTEKYNLSTKTIEGWLSKNFSKLKESI